jgi:very-short-patch-repair endonuclease
MRGEQPWRTNRSRVLRSQHPRNRQLGGHKFVRQAPIDAYFVDFACRERKVVVEVDGGTHSTDAELAHDARRTRRLEQLGYRVFRVSNDDVHNNLDGAVDTLLAFIETPR